MRPPAATGPKPMSVVAALTCSGKSSSPVSIFFFHHNRLFHTSDTLCTSPAPSVYPHPYTFTLRLPRTHDAPLPFILSPWCPRCVAQWHSGRVGTFGGVHRPRYSVTYHEKPRVASAMRCRQPRLHAWFVRCSVRSVARTSCRLFYLNRFIVSYRLDQSHVRFEREDGYCASLSSVTDDEMQNWNGPSASLLFHTPPVLPSGYPAPSWEMSNAEIQQIMPQDWCRRESQWRQEHGCLIACHQAEVRGLSAIAVQTRNPRLPEALLPCASSSFLDVETLTIVTYLGVYLMCHLHSKWWFVLESEWIRNTAIAARYLARRGRLPWLSSSVCDAIGHLGISNIFPDIAIQAEFSAILREIELIRWPIVLPRNHLLPWHSSSHPSLPLWRLGPIFFCGS